MQLVSFSKPFMPVSAPEAGLIISVFPLRVNSITSPFAVPSYVFGPSRLEISIEYLSPFFVMLMYVPSTPGHRPTSVSGFPLSPVAAGLPVGEVTGDVAGLAVATEVGVGDASCFTSGVAHAANPMANAAKTDNRSDLLNLLLIFIVLVRAVLLRRISRLQPSGSFSRSSLFSGPASCASL